MCRQGHDNTHSVPCALLLQPLPCSLCLHTPFIAGIRSTNVCCCCCWKHHFCCCTTDNYTNAAEAGTSTVSPGRLTKIAATLNLLMYRPGLKASLLCICCPPSNKALKVPSPLKLHSAEHTTKTKGSFTQQPVQRICTSIQPAHSCLSSNGSDSAHLPTSFSPSALLSVPHLCSSQLCANPCASSACTRQPVATHSCNLFHCLKARSSNRKIPLAEIQQDATDTMRVAAPKRQCLSRQK